VVNISINDDLTITNIYKPPKTPFEPPPLYKHPAIYSGILTVITHHGILYQQFRWKCSSGMG